MRVVKRSSYISTGNPRADVPLQRVGEGAGLAGLVGVVALQPDREADDDPLDALLLDQPQQLTAALARADPQHRGERRGDRCPTGR